MYDQCDLQLITSHEEIYRQVLPGWQFAVCCSLPHPGEFQEYKIQVDRFAVPTGRSGPRCPGAGRRGGGVRGRRGVGAAPQETPLLSPLPLDHLERPAPFAKLVLSHN